MRVDVEEADGQTPARQSEQDLLVDGAIGPMQEAASGRVFQQGRQVVGPAGNRGTEQFVGVVPSEATTLPEVRPEEPDGASPEPEPDREEHRRPQPDTEVLARPPAGEGEDVAGRGQLVGGCREVERHPHGTRVEHQADDRVRDVVDRHDVDAEVASGWNDPAALPDRNSRSGA